MFYGEFFHSIDRKGRLIMPAKFREAAKGNFVEKFYVTRGLDTCLFMFAEEEWKAQEQKFKAISFTKQESRIFNRLYFSGAAEIMPDRQGRVLLPQYLKDFAEIKKGLAEVEKYSLNPSRRIAFFIRRLVRHNARYQSLFWRGQVIAEDFADPGEHFIIGYG